MGIKYEVQRVEEVVSVSLVGVHQGGFQEESGDSRGRDSLLQKGGVPAAPSGTATLLRLRPNRQSHLRRLPNEFRPPAKQAPTQKMKAP